jgi:glycine/D-amino acid oxidase-like deaminating enzyme
MSPTNQVTVAVFGAGIASPAVAHELCRLGYQVAVYESSPETGSFFRSGRQQRPICRLSIPGMGWLRGTITFSTFSNRYPSTKRVVPKDHEGDGVRLRALDLRARGDGEAHSADAFGPPLGVDEDL